MLRLIAPNGQILADDLETALGVKDLVHYGTKLLSTDRHRSLMRAVRRLCAAAAVAASG